MSEIELHLTDEKAMRAPEGFRQMTAGEMILHMQRRKGMSLAEKLRRAREG